MSELIQDISFTQFRLLKAGELRKLKSFAVTSDGEYLFTVIIPQTAYIQAQAEYLAQLSNGVGGKSLKEYILEPEKMGVS